MITLRQLVIQVIQGLGLNHGMKYVWTLKSHFPRNLNDTYKTLLINIQPRKTKKTLHFARMKQGFSITDPFPKSINCLQQSTSKPAPDPLIFGIE